jgi:hypothetical protein
MQIIGGNLNLIVVKMVARLKFVLLPGVLLGEGCDQFKNFQMLLLF